MSELNNYTKASNEGQGIPVRLHFITLLFYMKYILINIIIIILYHIYFIYLNLN